MNKASTYTLVSVQMSPKLLNLFPCILTKFPHNFTSWQLCNTASLPLKRRALPNERRWHTNGYIDAGKMFFRAIFYGAGEFGKRHPSLPLFQRALPSWVWCEQKIVRLPGLILVLQYACLEFRSQMRFLEVVQSETKQLNVVVVKWIWRYQDH